MEQVVEECRVAFEEEGVEQVALEELKKVRFLFIESSRTALSPAMTEFYHLFTDMFERLIER